MSSPEVCYCARCNPTLAPVQCSRCGEEIRYGWRAGQEDWLHRGDVDHAPILGHMTTLAEHAEIERQLDLPRTRTNQAGQEVVYTTRTWRSKRGSKAEGDTTENEDAVPTWDGVIPEPELRADRSVVPWPLRESVPNGVWLVLKPALAAGLEVARLTFARGPWTHSGGQRPPIQDTCVLAIRAAWLDSGTRAAVGCWRHVGDNWKFEHGLLITDYHAEFVSAADIKSWIKTIKGAQRG